MKKTKRQIVTRFKPQIEAEEATLAPVPGRGVPETELEQLKARLLRSVLTDAANPALKAPFRRAANEAASLAWFTPFPLLFFPALLEEKVYTAQRQQARQRQIRRRTQNLLSKVVCE
jgi:hypothetical protein